MNTARVNQLYYITHVENLPSILSLGILSHSQVESRGIQYEPIYDADIVAGRKSKIAPDGRSLWEFANCYFQPRNPMLYRVVREKSPTDIAVIGLRPDILNAQDIFITNGNAASGQSEILTRREGLKAISGLRKVFRMEYWSVLDGSKRKIMAECLLPAVIPPQYIQTVYVSSRDVARRVEALLKGQSVPVVPEPGMFFQPSRRQQLTPRLALVLGDLFYSHMQTMTVSVNCVGVMGKGLASRAKYQFPDVYVLYQDLCRKRSLQLGRPRLYKRESSFDYELADEPSTLQNSNGETWFLLFPTKQHWRQQASLTGIREGLNWLTESYKKEGIKSLAIPALGCGLGWLDWREVGPILCQALAQLEVDVWLYLPLEREIDSQFLSKEFLMGS